MSFSTILWIACVSHVFRLLVGNVIMSMTQLRWRGSWPSADLISAMILALGMSRLCPGKSPNVQTLGSQIRSGNYSSRRYKFMSHILREVWGSVILRGLPNTYPSCERGGHYLSRQEQTFHAYVMAGGNNNSSLPLSSWNRGYFAYDHRMAWTSSAFEYAWKWPVSSYPFDSTPNKALEVTEQPYGLLIKYHCLF